MPGLPGGFPDVRMGERGLRGGSGMDGARGVTAGDRRPLLSWAA